MARLFDGDAQRAVVALRHGLTLNPNDPQNAAWYILLAYAQLFAAAPDEALDSASKALAVRPVFSPTFEVLACCTAALGRLDDARRWAARIAEADGPERHFVAPMRANQPEYGNRIVWLLQKASV